jgi:hypothetical protein
MAYPAQARRETRIVVPRLLELRLGDGWEPLCAFLGVPVPGKPYPRVNNTNEFNQGAEVQEPVWVNPIPHPVIMLEKAIHGLRAVVIVVADACAG